MDDVRMLFVRLVNESGQIVVDEKPDIWSRKIQCSILESIYLVICSYIRTERDNDEMWGMGTSERRYLCTDDFLTTDDEKKWIEDHRTKDDNGLIIHIFDNVYDMTPGKHRRTLLYLLNILYFDL
jgi:hypothetical protein